jgi:hypothetical protein
MISTALGFKGAPTIEPHKSMLRFEPVATEQLCTLIAEAKKGRALKFTFVLA